MTLPDPCRSCGAPIIWAITDRGKRLPLDAMPNPAGNVRLTGGNAIVLKKDDVYDGPRYMPHFATCKDADKWRKK
jgi:hypothetical protein